VPMGGERGGTLGQRNLTGGNKYCCAPRRTTVGFKIKAFLVREDKKNVLRW
jgi:hypothetical protein